MNQHELWKNACIAENLGVMSRASQGNEGNTHVPTWGRTATLNHSCSLDKKNVWGVWTGVLPISDTTREATRTMT